MLWYINLLPKPDVEIKMQFSYLLHRIFSFLYFYFNIFYSLVSCIHLYCSWLHAFSYDFIRFLGCFFSSAIHKEDTFQAAWSDCTAYFMNAHVKRGLFLFLWCILTRYEQCISFQDLLRINTMETTMYKLS